MNLFLYFEINLICLLFLGFIHVQLNRSINRESTIISFELVVLGSCCMLIISFVWFFFQKNPSDVRIFLNYLFSYLYLLGSWIVCLFWIRHVHCFINKYHSSIRNNFLYILPVSIWCVLLFFSLSDNCIFYIDQNNTFQTGDLYFLSVLLLFFYPFISIADLLISIKREVNIKNVARLRVLCRLSILGSIFGFIGMFFPLYPITWPSISLFLYLMHMIQQNRLVSQDGLTGVQNRLSFNQRLFYYLQNSESPFCLFMIDIDHFKQINDLFGHVEGDLILIQIANLLSSLTNNEHFLLCRYGGDEFAILGHFSSLYEAELFRKKIYTTVSSSHESGVLTHPVSLSVGICFHENGEKTPDEIIHLADLDMYREKAAHHWADH